MVTQSLRFRSQARFREALQHDRSALLAAGRMINKPVRQFVRARTLPSYALVYLIAGAGVYNDARNGRRAVAAGDALVLFPGLKHDYGSEGSGTWSEYFLIFQGRIFEQLEAEGAISRSNPVLSPGIQTEFSASFNRLIDDFIRRPGSYETLLAARAYLLLAELVALDDAARRVGAQPDFAHQAAALLEQNLEGELDLAQVARSFHLSYERFRKRFAAEIGVSPVRFRMLRRIDRAKTLLAEERLPLKEVSARLGYCDLYFFCRQFKQVTGVAPGEFRRSV